jgi:hypothetical protein
MSYIACEDPCIYQDAGLCRLERAGSCGMPDGHISCVYFLPKATKAPGFAQETPNCDGNILL